MFERVRPIGATSLTVSAKPERDGNGNACPYAKLPTFSATMGSRDIGFSRNRPDGLAMMQSEFHTGRPAVR